VTIQRRLVPAGGFLLLYHIGEEQSFLFVIPATGTPEALPLRVSDEDARALGVSSGELAAKVLEELLGTAPAGGAVSPARSSALLGQLSRSPTSNANRAEATLSRDRLHALWRVLTPDTAWRRVRGAREIVVVPGRGLHTLPFEALVVHTGVTPAQTRYWIDDGPAIRYAPSASTLNSIEQRPAVRPGGQTRASVLSVSDPIFDPSQITQQAAARAQARQDEPLTRGRFLESAGALERLPGTAAETEAIRAAFGGARASGALVSLQTLDATEGAVRPALLGKRYVHLATHGLVDETRGALFAALALTPPTAPSADDDGFLQLHEIYQLRLPELELAVLSACETNRGTTVAGEGVFALSRGFLAAGARRVIASEWVVEDRSTAELMGRYFREIVAAEAGGRIVDHAVALRDAKRAIRQKPGWEHPFFWAPFVLVGEPRVN